VHGSAKPINRSQPRAFFLSSIEDADAIEPRAAFNDQTAARRDDLRHMGQEHAGQRVGRAKSDRQVHPDRHEMRKLDRRLHCDQEYVLLPLSDDGAAIDHALGAANYRSLRADEALIAQVIFRTQWL
jgi:hypothetical protein